MLFPTAVFAIFFAIIFTLHWALPERSLARKVVLLLASLVFYGWWSWKFALMLLASAVLNHGTVLLFKKTVIANWIALKLADPLFNDPAAYGALDATVGVLGYALQIYCDFSAYSDIATGCALLLGFHFPANFNAPYLSVSLQDFWRRWHISLSSWLRDYLYIPLGGSRCSAWKTYRNLAITMLLGGLWHGASWTFVLWGGILGLGLSIERAILPRRKKDAPPSAPVPIPLPDHPPPLAHHPPHRLLRLDLLPLRLRRGPPHRHPSPRRLRPLRYPRHPRHSIGRPPPDHHPGPRPRRRRPLHLLPILTEPPP